MDERTPEQEALRRENLRLNPNDNFPELPAFRCAEVPGDFVRFWPPKIEIGTGWAEVRPRGFLEMGTKYPCTRITAVLTEADLHQLASEIADSIGYRLVNKLEY